VQKVCSDKDMDLYYKIIYGQLPGAAVMGLKDFFGALRLAMTGVIYRYVDTKK
jgi:hypothetical protein